MEQYKKLNIIIGWVVFLMASTVYLLTIEPTVSLWDCGEFIASAYKLEVGHPPGAPFYMLLARFFSLFAPGEEFVAMFANAMSGLASAFTILFLFWTITHLAQKSMVKNEDFTRGKMLAVFGAGLVGALSYAFTDTFWFSAAEGEVYALSSLFTAFVFWAILKWENIAFEPHSNRWLVLIAYLMGLSIGVHLLNLLAIPAIVFVYYYRKYEVTKKGIFYAALISVVILGVIMYGLIPGIVKVATWFELLFVNGFGMPYNSGVIFYIILLVGLIVWGLQYTKKKNKVLLNTIITMFTVIAIGYSSFSLIVIRSLANPPMDENDPENVFSLLSYLNREQYGDRPLVYGQYFSAPVDGREEGKPVYIQEDGEYKVSYYKPEYEYDEKFTTFFPRMWSSGSDHVQAYKDWGKIEGRTVRVRGNDGNTTQKVIPTFGENLRFFFTYQIGFMYFRYFMWNFAGKQNDTQGHGGILKGNWISGLDFVDSPRIGSQKDLPAEFAREKSRNTYFLLPLILGIIGLLYQYQRDHRNFFVVALLFILTGIAIVVYLNQYPYQPRERDYAYAGSFYAFSIWIGFAVLSFFDLIRKKLAEIPAALMVTVICLFISPAILARENWDDHDRSGRYTARDIAHNYLNSCAPNAILFTNGDNDTFPLWYAQEVEGIRTDVRVVNLSLLNTDWYINQMKRKAYDSEPVPFTLNENKYRQGTNDIIYMVERLDDFVNARNVINFVANDDQRTKLKIGASEQVDYIPTSRFEIPVDSANVIQNGIVRPENADKIVPSIKWRFKRRYLQKSDLLMLDLFAHFNWERPVYFVSPTNDVTLGLKDYLQLEGFAYRLVPIKTSSSNVLNTGRVDSDILYDKLMNKFKWGRMNEPDVFIDHYTRRTTSVIKVRHNFNRLAEKLIEENKTDSAIAVLDRIVELMPMDKFPYDFYMTGIIESYYDAGDIEKAIQLTEVYSENLSEKLTYFFNLEREFISNITNEIGMEMQMYQRLMSMANTNNQTELHNAMQQEFEQLYMKYSQLQQ